VTNESLKLWLMARADRMIKVDAEMCRTALKRIEYLEESLRHLADHFGCDCGAEARALLEKETVE
jgi:hypothetical protein